jgi:pyruvate dehydrogenase E2 component (dihydrolipoamide acetyltransferase)
MGEFRMPSLGADMDAGTIVEWRVKPGDEVHRGDVVAVIDTDKADIDAEIFEDGLIAELVVGVGDKVPVGTVLAIVSPVAGAAPEASVAREAAPARAGTASAPVLVAVPTGPSAHAPQVHSPLVRHLAEHLGVDLTTLHGTGVGGSITRADVQAAAAAPAARPSRAAPARVDRRARVSPRARHLASRAGIEPSTLRGTGPGGAVTGRDIEAATAAMAARPAAEPREVTMRRRIATLMARSNREIPHYWVERTVDFSAAAAWLGAHNSDVAPADRILPAAVVLAATARAAATVPGFNGWWVDDDLHEAADVDLGLVVSLRTGGLLVPVIKGAGELTVGGIMARLGDVVRRARTGHLRSSELGEPSITVTNLGDQGGDAVLGRIYPPQVALVGVGRLAERPWVDGGVLTVRPVLALSLAGDHRATDGHQASRFLAALDSFVQTPESLEEVP